MQIWTEIARQGTDGLTTIVISTWVRVITTTQRGSGVWMREEICPYSTPGASGTSYSTGMATKPTDSDLNTTLMLVRLIPPPTAEI